MAYHSFPAGSSPLELRAGPLRVMLDGIDLRYVSYGEIELVRRLQAAVRDTDWGTVPAQVDRLELEREDERFRLRFEARHRRGPLRFAWRGTVEGSDSGSITYELDGSAESDFSHNRIGLCALLPPESWAGRLLEVDGRRAELPRLVAPQALVDGVEEPVLGPFQELRLELADPGSLRLRFSGDRFEIEDQRNWSDASFKAYSTPLALGYPHRVAAGGRIRQRIELSLGGPPRRAVMPGAARCPSPPGADDGAVKLTVGPALTSAPPALGTRVVSGPWPAGAVERLRAAGLAHLRIDLTADDPEAGERLRAALASATAIEADLELALHVREAEAAPLRDLFATLPAGAVARILVFAADAAELEPTETTPSALVGLVRRLARGAGIIAPVGGGSSLGFVALNRTRPSPGSLETLAFPVCPTVHAADERSIVETLSAQPMMLETARTFAPGVPIAVTPITLAAPDGPPDRRQATQFAAAWTIGCATALATAGAASATLFEATGPGGLIGAEGAPAPTHAALAALAGWAEGSVRPLRADRRFAASGLLLRSTARSRLLIANLTAGPLALRLDGLDPAEREAVRGRLELDPYAVFEAELPAGA
ncbi:MAG: hypothetical protein JSS97_06300 [Actinobacteria bacterium]|nr:hypothetical protein [Actinomycetota bacterium]